MFSDKTNNLYKVNPGDYNKLLTENITKDYMKCEKDTIDKINQEAEKLIKKNVSPARYLN